MALFLGSDYTLGIKGIGIVNAYEIVSTFDNFESLRRFKEWASLPDIFLENHQKYYENISEKEKNFKLFHQNFKNLWEIPDDFPSKKVYEAYLTPKVDTNASEIQWGKPHYESLSRYCIK